LSVAHHEVARTLMCDECFRDKPSKGAKTELAAQVLKEKRKDTTMARHTDEATKAPILKDAAEGMGTNAIATKHGVSWPTAKRIIDGNGQRVKSGKKAVRAKSSAKPSNGIGAGPITAM